MSGLVILSHGLESGPDATKVSALAVVAESLGWRTLRPDYRDLDARGLAAAAQPRLERLVAAIPPGERVLLAGSSFGAFISGLASLQRAVAGLFLLATPHELPGYARPFAMAERVRAMLVHGWRDELCPVDAAIAIARGHGAELLLLDDDHRLSAHVDAIAAQFRLFLEAL